MMNIIVPSVYIVLLVMLGIFDYKYRIIPNKLIYPGIAVVLALSYFWIGIISSLVGGAIMLGILLLPLIVKVKVGMGDVKLGVLIGLMVGFPMLVVNILITGVISIILCVFLVVTKKKKLADLIPYGSIMCIAATITIIKGYDLWILITSLGS